MNKTILMVDDDIVQLTLFKNLLTSNGYICKTALSVDDAESILRHEIPDLIISDFQMPVRDGFDFRRILLEHDLLKQVPFLFLTSVDDNDFVQQGLDLKAIDYISKGTPAKQVLSKIDNLMQSVRQHYEKSLSEIKGIAEKLNLRNTPRTSPVMENFSVSFANTGFQDHPGGDFIDFIKVNDRYTFVVLGDVMGKKWGAWFFSFSFLSYIRSAIRLCVFEGNFSLSEIMHKLNNVIYCDELLGDIFSTLSIVLLDDELKTINYCGAGDLPLLKYDKEKNTLVSYQSEGILLGFSVESKFSETKIELNPGDELFLISDGMIDFEIEGVKRSDIDIFKSKLQILKENGRSAAEIREALFDKHTTQVDDCSIITIKRVKNEYE